MIDRIAGHIFQKTRLVIKGHLLNPLWRKREIRRRKTYEVTYESVMQYLQRYADCIRDYTPQEIPKSDTAEKAFTIWLQGEENAPELVKACFRSMRRNLEMELVVLDENSLFEWIKLPDHIVEKWKKGKIRNAHFSDICRVELLYQYGGVWLDATDYMTSHIPQDILEADFFMYLAGSKIRGSYSFVQNCFIRARKGNQLLGVWRHAIHKYWENENKVIDYFMHQLLFKLSIDTNEIASRLFNMMPHKAQDPTHTLWSAYYRKEYDQQEFQRLTANSFFQKTNYKSKGIEDLDENSYGYFLINS